MFKIRCKIVKMLYIKSVYMGAAILESREVYWKVMTMSMHAPIISW